MDVNKVKEGEREKNTILSLQCEHVQVDAEVVATGAFYSSGVRCRIASFPLFNFAGIS